MLFGNVGGGEAYGGGDQQMRKEVRRSIIEMRRTSAAVPSTTTAETMELGLLHQVAEEAEDEFAGENNLAAKIEESNKTPEEQVEQKDISALEITVPEKCDIKPLMRCPICGIGRVYYRYSIPGMLLTLLCCPLGLWYSKKTRQKQCLDCGVLLGEERRKSFKPPSRTVSLAKSTETAYVNFF